MAETSEFLARRQILSASSDIRSRLGGCGLFCGEKETDLVLVGSAPTLGGIGASLPLFMGRSTGSAGCLSVSFDAMAREMF